MPIEVRDDVLALGKLETLPQMITKLIKRSKKKWPGMINLYRVTKSDCQRTIFLAEDITNIIVKNRRTFHIEGKTGFIVGLYEIPGYFATDIDVYLELIKLRHGLEKEAIEYYRH